MAWTVARVAGEREQLIGLINACQQSLGELLRRLQAARTPGRDPEGPAQSDIPPIETGRAERLIVETIGRLEDLAPAPAVAREEIEAVRAATEDLASRLAGIDRGIEQRMVRTADLAARGAEVAVQDRLRSVRAEIDSVRSALGEAATDLRAQAAARGSEIAAVRTALDGVRRDVARLDVSLDERIASKVDAAWRAVDGELARIQARVDALAARLAVGAWATLRSILVDGLDALGMVLRRVVARS